MTLVVALGGNALLRPGEAPEAGVQRHNARSAAAEVAALARHHRVVVTHGNGPQVGRLALQAAAGSGSPDPLDVLGAESEGLIGYLLQQELASARPGHTVVTLLTQVEVDGSDPAFSHPTKPIGPVYDPDRAARLARRRGWVLGPDKGGLRRLVPSPAPVRILEMAAVRVLVDAGVMVVCAGGGGVPVTVDSSGRVAGVEAVVDKDLSAALLAVELDAESLVLLTDVEAVIQGWGTPAARPVASGCPDCLRRLDLAEGTMGPKVEAACRFASLTGRPAYIGALGQAAAVLSGSAGTRVSPTCAPSREAGDTSRPEGAGNEVSPAGGPELPSCVRTRP